MQHIALCGGTFDPFHRGHLEAPLSIRPMMQWDRIVYIPAHQQPFKVGRRQSSPFHRHAMTVLGTIDAVDLEVSTLELERENVSYTVDTLETMRTKFPSAVLDWIIGDDNLEALVQWRAIDRIFKLANFVVLQRHPDASLPAELESRLRTAAERGVAGSIVMVQNPAVPISSTAIRERVARGESIDGMVHPHVERYIRKNKLYIEGEH